VRVCVCVCDYINLFRFQKGATVLVVKYKYDKIIRQDQTTYDFEYMCGH